MKTHPQGIIELGPNRFSVNASQLQILPGTLPREFSPSPALGDDQPFTLTGIDERGSGFYRQPVTGITIRIVNDVEATILKG